MMRSKTKKYSINEEKVFGIKKKHRAKRYIFNPEVRKMLKESEPIIVHTQKDLLDILGKVPKGTKILFHEVDDEKKQISYYSTQAIIDRAGMDFLFKEQWVLKEKHMEILKDIRLDLQGDISYNKIGLTEEQIKEIYKMINERFDEFINP